MYVCVSLAHGHDMYPPTTYPSIHLSIYASVFFSILDMDVERDVILDPNGDWCDGCLWGCGVVGLIVCVVLPCVRGRRGMDWDGPIDEGVR